MKNILERILCAVLILALPLLILVSAFVLPDPYEESFLAGLDIKWDRLTAQTQQKRILVIGGSGVSFALRSDLLEQEFPGYQVVNMGLYAGLGTTVMLDLVSTQVQEGDILIFAPEISEQTLSTYFDGQNMLRAWSKHPFRLFLLDTDEKKGVIGALPAFAQEKLKLLSARRQEADGIYQADSYTTYGDISCEAGLRDSNVMSEGYDRNMPVTYDTELLTDDFVSKVNEISKLCQKAGASLYWGWCPTNEAAVEDTDEDSVEAFEHAVEERLDCEMIGHAEDAILDAGWFYDTNYHLNSSGAILYTALLAEELKQLPEFALEESISAGVSFSIPDMPEMNGQNQEDGSADNEGTAEEIASLLSGDPQETEILIIPDTIEELEDGCFEEYKQLKKIVLTERTPSSLRIGSGLLDGTDADVYVPKEQLSAYRTDYFWSVLGLRVKPYDEEVKEALTEYNSGTDADHTEDTDAETAQNEDGQTTQNAGQLSTASQDPLAAAALKKKKMTITYDANGGSLRNSEETTLQMDADQVHIRPNTLAGTRYFVRDGYLLAGWNTKADGSGMAIGLGSRIDRTGDLTLYAQWVKASDESFFTWEVRQNAAWITSIHLSAAGQSEVASQGDTTECVLAVPESLDGLPVEGILSGALSDANLSELYLPSTLKEIEENAFVNCTITTIHLYDSLEEISDESFCGISGLKKLQIQAATSPVYSGTYYDTFAEKYDWLIQIQDVQKIVLASGSSGRYGYDSEMIREAFPDYEVANMGVYAYTNELPQLELIRLRMKEGDLLLSAPEFDAAEQQFCASNALDHHFWAMMESNYDLVQLLNMQNYEAIFSSLGEYLQLRGQMEGQNYSVHPWSFDDDGNQYAFSTYNVYGDFILNRPDGEEDICLRHNIADYTINNIPEDYISSINEVYRTFQKKGVVVYFTYTPRNIRSLTEDSTEENRKRLDTYLKERICVPVISDIEDYLFEGYYFWLIDSHLSTNGAKIRTNLVIRDLKEYDKALQ